MTESASFAKPLVVSHMIESTSFTKSKAVPVDTSFTKPKAVSAGTGIDINELIDFLIVIVQNRKH